MRQMQFTRKTGVRPHILKGFDLTPQLIEPSFLFQDVMFDATQPDPSGKRKI
jgi:hypothetical protein